MCEKCFQCGETKKDIRIVITNNEDKQIEQYLCRDCEPQSLLRKIRWGRYAFILFFISILVMAWQKEGDRLPFVLFNLIYWGIVWIILEVYMSGRRSAISKDLLRSKLNLKAVQQTVKPDLSIYWTGGAALIILAAVLNILGIYNKFIMAVLSLSVIWGSVNLLMQISTDESINKKTNDLPIKIALSCYLALPVIFLLFKGEAYAEFLKTLHLSFIPALCFIGVVSFAAACLIAVPIYFIIHLLTGSRKHYGAYYIERTDSNSKHIEAKGDKVSDTITALLVLVPLPQSLIYIAIWFLNLLAHS